MSPSRAPQVLLDHRFTDMDECGRHLDWSFDFRQLDRGRLDVGATRLATAAGSTAYNSSVRGPILPLGTDAMALTPISPFRPRRWSGAILPSSAHVTFEVINHYKRSVSATADAYEVRDIVRVDAFEDKTLELKLLFDPDHSLEERILNEQFQ